MSTTLWDESDSDDDLPPEWEQLVNHETNAVNYHNRLTGFTQHHHPITGHIKQLSDRLPVGWCTTFDQHGSTCFKNALTGVTTGIDPRVITAYFTQPKLKKSDRQFKHDRYSSVTEILLNKDLRGQFIIVTGAGCGLGLLIALQLFDHGATVVCGSCKCPTLARPLYIGESKHIQLANDKGNLFWILYDAMRLNSVIEFMQTYKSFNWPLDTCIIVADRLHTGLDSNLLCQISNKLKFKLLFNKIPLLPLLSNVVCKYIVGSFHWLMHTLCPTWIPPTSCECLDADHSVKQTFDGFEVMMQWNYLAPVLLIKLITEKCAETSQMNDATHEDTTVVIVSSELHKAAVNIPTYLSTNDWTELFYRIPQTSACQLKQYACTKFFLLLYCHYLTQSMSNLNIDSSNSLSNMNTSSNVNIFVSTGNDPFGFHCINGYRRQFKQLLLNSPLIFFIQFLYSLTRPFGQSLAQAAACPVFCAVNSKSIRNALLSNETRRQNPINKRFVYLNYCKPALSSLDEIPNHQLVKLNKMLTVATNQLFISSNLYRL